MNPAGEPWTEAEVAAFYQQVGARVRERRTAARLTQLRLSQHLGMTRTSVANLEAGRQRIPLHVLAVVADAVGCDTAELLPGGPQAAARPCVDLAALRPHLDGLEASSREFVESLVATVAVVDTAEPEPGER